MAMSDMNEVLIFTRVAQLGSFSKASKVMSIPVSTVSRKVSGLEARLGTTLIQRTTRKLSLTRQGQLFYEQCAFHFHGIEEAETLLRQTQNQPSGHLRVTIPVALGRTAFIDLISGFLKAHPKIKLDLIVTNQHLDFVSENIDVAIRFGHLKDSTVIAKKLGSSRRVLLASPEYLKNSGVPKDPRELENHHCILFLGQKEELEWELVNEKRKVRVKVSGIIAGSDFNTVNEFALRGHGIALLPAAYCLSASNKNQLKQILPQWNSPPSPVHAIYMSRKFMPIQVQAFLKCLSEWKSPHWN